MSTCPDFGRLRAWIDSEDPGVERHLAGCATCGDTATALRRNADLAAGSIGLLAPPPTAEAEQAPPAPAAEPEEAEVVSLPRRRALARVAAAAVVVLVAGTIVGTPSGRSATAGFLAQFRSERLAVVTFDPAELGETFEGLERLGRVSGDFRTEPVTVDSVSAAAEVTGIEIATPAPAMLPDGVTPDPTIYAVEQRQLRLEFDRDIAPEVPAALDGAVLRVDVPAFVVVQYPSRDGGPGLVVTEAGQVTADVEGTATLDEVRAFLLDSGNLPADVSRQLLAIDDWRSTLPLPVPVDAVAWQDIVVQGGPGVLLGDESGLGSAVLWQADGRIHGAAGPLPASEVRRLAEQL